MLTSPSAGTGFVVSEYFSFEESPNSSTTRAFIDIFLHTNLTLPLRVNGFRKNTAPPNKLTPLLIVPMHLGNRSMLEKLVSSSHVTCEDEADERRGVTVTTGNQVVAVPI